MSYTSNSIIHVYFNKINIMNCQRRSKSIVKTFYETNISTTKNPAHYRTRISFLGVSFSPEIAACTRARKREQKNLLQMPLVFLRIQFQLSQLNISKTRSIGDTFRIPNFACPETLLQSFRDKYCIVNTIIPNSRK